MELDLKIKPLQLCMPKKHVLLEVLPNPQTKIVEGMP
jgi:hypothetical protein